MAGSDAHPFLFFRGFEHLPLPSLLPEVPYESQVQVAVEESSYHRY